MHKRLGGGDTENDFVYTIFNMKWGIAVEKNILAYFKDPEHAEKAADQLKEMGITELRIDRFSKYPGDGNDLINPLRGGFDSLSSLTLNAEVDDRSQGILLGADVGSSGMSDGGQDELAGYDILLTVVVDEALHHQAMNLIRNHGGML